MIQRFSACVESAFRRTKTLLWPFNARVWLILFFLHVFTGGLGGFSGVRGSFPNSVSPSAPSSAVAAAPLSNKAKLENVLRQGKSFLRDNQKNILTLSVIFLILGLILMALSAWLSARLKMVLIQCLRGGAFHLRDAWRDTRALGEALFRFNLLAILLAGAPLVIAAGFAAEAVLRHGWTGLGAALKAHWLMLILAGGSVFVYVLSATIVLMTVNQFLPVYMAMTGQGPRAAFAELRRAGREKMWNGLGAVLLYGLVIIGVGIAVGLALAILGILLALVFGGGALIGVALVKILHVPQLAVITAGVILALPVFFAFLVLGAVPGETFKSYLAIELMESFTSRPS